MMKKRPGPLAPPERRKSIILLLNVNKKYYI